MMRTLSIFAAVLLALILSIPWAAHAAAPAKPPCWPLWGGTGTDLNADSVPGAGTWAAWRCGADWFYVLSPVEFSSTQLWAMVRKFAPAGKADSLWSQFVTLPVTDPSLAKLKVAADAYAKSVK